MVMYVIALMTLLDKLRPEALGIKFTQAWYAYSIVVTRPEPFSKQQTDGTCMHGPILTSFGESLRTSLPPGGAWQRVPAVIRLRPRRRPCEDGPLALSILWPEARVVGPSKVIGSFLVNELNGAYSGGGTFLSPAQNPFRSNKLMGRI